MVPPSPIGNSETIWTIVFPGGIGPARLTCKPFVRTSGDDPSSSVVASEPFGMSNANGGVGFTGADPLFTISRMK